MNNKRNYSEELKDTSDHQYGYDFDYDVIHPFMIRSFEPFLGNRSNVLELGSHLGDFTSRLLPVFENITCVEGSSEAARLTRDKFKNRVNIINDIFESVQLPAKYDNIVLTHVLEHIDDPVALMRRVNEEWLTDSGRFFGASPNANAPSRQIAVKMGLISHNAGITDAEDKHGHRITYSLDTLERDAKAAGLKVVHRSGIFFEALANFQWDRVIQENIVSKEYLEGCYELGMIYPDLCSSIYLVCEKG